MYVLTPILLSALAVAQPSPHCLEYEPKTVALEGKLVQQTFAEPPNHESQASGDAAETYFILELKQAFCLNASKSTPAINGAQADVTRVQLVITQREYREYASWIGREVSVRGELFEGHTGHHHTSVLLTVKDIQSKAYGKPPLVDVKGPTLIAFLVPVDTGHSSDDDNEVHADFSVFALEQAKSCRQNGIHFEELHVHSFRVRDGERLTLFRPTKITVGYYLLAPRKKPRVEYGVNTDSDLMEIAREYFGSEIEPEGR
jgi:hypothetical protein